MEDWRQTLETGDNYDQEQDKRNWGDFPGQPLGSFHDPSQPWKPSQAAYARGYSISLAQDDPDLLIRTATDAATTTLIEKETCADDVIKVWDEVSKFIVEKLKEGHGVKIAGLGTFIYCEDFTDPCEPKKVPLMILSDFIVRMYKLITPLDESLCTIPICPINIPAIATKSRIPRRIVDGIITEVLQSFSRAIVLNKNVEFPFPNIGKLQICKRKVVFRFYAEFCVQLGFETEESVDPQLGENTNSFVLHGTMTPLRKHIPTTDFKSVFHLREVRSVRSCDLLAPVIEFEGKYVATSGLDKNMPLLIEDDSKRSAMSASSASVQTSRKCKNEMREILGPQLQHRYTISWVRGKRNYLAPAPSPWPRHHFHVVQSSVVFKTRNSSKTSGSENI